MTSDDGLPILAQDPTLWWWFDDGPPLDREAANAE